MSVVDEIFFSFCVPHLTMKRNIGEKRLIHMREKENEPTKESMI